ncbi:MoxR family ATPase [bacterium]|nr:MAG: MoxR family ATPase [bacterium]
MTQTKDIVDKIKAELDKVIVGQPFVKDHLIIALLSGGHVLLEGVPGTAKTLMVKTLALIMSSRFRRIQFTSDLMPSDVIGTNVFDAKTSSFILKKGPIFTNLVLIDEVNRAPAKTQAALLEVMEERQVTIDGTRYVLDEPFIVFATQNPIEYEGTYALPEAQLDRFMFKIVIDYPQAEDENQILRNYHNGFDMHHLESAHIQSAVTPDEILSCRAEIKDIKVEEGVINYITQIVRRTRDHGHILVGASPRASVALLLASKTRAAMNGSAYVTPDDIKAVAKPIMRHRIILQPETELEGIRADELIDEVLYSVVVPR